ncbi:RNA-guided pseudouridylation complex pseudouridine synthase subunit Cbf5 [Candidatus Woesearchaeota archaeon]|nr:RNA-guided pseudouridylation complex pseudouridine synthase subunit Cbf5 [Candidatus Woesearchaeota archaeon]
MSSQVLVKKEAEGQIGKEPEERTIAELLDKGVVNIDKPKGPTTHQIADFVKNILKIDKCGHSGSLDPAVTGVVIVGLGKSTKVVHYLLKAPKAYVCIMHVHKPVAEDKLRKAMESFVGKIEQLPPIRSAVKRRTRTKKVYSIKILEIDSQDVLFEVECEAGTYIRKLCHDLGEKLKTGAHMSELRRTKVGPFDEKTSFTLHDLKDAFVFWKEEGKEEGLKKIIQPMENAVSHLPKIWVLDTTVKSLTHGATLKTPGISKIDSGIQKGYTVAVMTLKNELILTGTAEMTSKEMLKEEKGIAVKAERVFMEP